MLYFITLIGVILATLKLDKQEQNRVSTPKEVVSGGIPPTYLVSLVVLYLRLG
jgi:hypothetical protein